ncbi:MAG: hypothetical protein JXL97_05855 [Bacteroidales bacterium]|nr:hypothetical protein [Bacteroidales bacterium]
MKIQKRSFVNNAKYLLVSPQIFIFLCVDPDVKHEVFYGFDFGDQPRFTTEGSKSQNE